MYKERGDQLAIHTASGKPYVERIEVEGVRR
jgi:hypothetical protein